ncbi:hypothetical protein IFR04_013852 [Cadophora malorum]|uniref:Uncharacterized protein n=1 Tax=Cadophora malorum TaxID=108018 RepID=A0A8H7T5T3_9HELO|nr:hypothetical protein IFR04_013852 [Cadophora malorum]
MATIRDSYSAGIGAGDKLGSANEFLNPDNNYACSCYNYAYPLIVNKDKRLGDNMNRKFQFKLCSGAMIDDVLRR